MPKVNFGTVVLQIFVTFIIIVLVLCFVLGHMVPKLEQKHQEYLATKSEDMSVFLTTTTVLTSDNL